MTLALAPIQELLPAPPVEGVSVARDFLLNLAEHPNAGARRLLWGAQDIADAPRQLGYRVVTGHGRQPHVLRISQ